MIRFKNFKYELPLTVNDRFCVLKTTVWLLLLLPLSLFLFGDRKKKVYCHFPVGRVKLN